MAYDIVSHLLRKSSANAPSTHDLKKLLVLIEKTIHQETNRARYAMNNCLIAIGSYIDELYDETILAAERIGKVIVDHATTGCKTPDAIPYIAKVRKRRDKLK